MVTVLHLIDASFPFLSVSHRTTIVHVRCPES